MLSKVKRTNIIVGGIQYIIADGLGRVYVYVDYLYAC